YSLCAGDDHEVSLKLPLPCAVFVLHSDLAARPRVVPWKGREIRVFDPEVKYPILVGVALAVVLGVRRDVIGPFGKVLRPTIANGIRTTGVHRSSGAWRN